jgi:hypothetical protein
MFGVLKTSSAGWDPDLRSEWVGHVCGTCLALGQAGQPYRFLTNYDSALISALIDAQSDEPSPRVEHYCPLRKSRRAVVVSRKAPSTTYAAALTTLAMSTKITDHMDDGDGVIARWPRIFGYMARRARKASQRFAQRVGFDLELIEDQVDDQDHREAQTGADFQFYSEPTERSLAAAFAHTAEVAGRPENRELLAEIGGLCGRLMLLFDSVEDLEKDRETGRFNALAAASSDVGLPEAGPDSDRDADIEALALGIFRDATARIHELLPQLDLVRSRLVEKLLITELDRVGERVFGPRE